MKGPDEGFVEGRLGNDGLFSSTDGVYQQLPLLEGGVNVAEQEYDEGNLEFCQKFVSGGTL